MGKAYHRVIISRTDGIGDVVLTLPMAAAIKTAMPGAHIIFLGRSYTRAVVERCSFVDAFLNWDTLEKLPHSEQGDILKRQDADVILHVFPRKEICIAAKKAAIPLRVATGKRWHTLTTCNKLLWYSRKKSNLHEAQLNLMMLGALGLKDGYALSELPAMYGFRTVKPLPSWLVALGKDYKFQLVLHPKSKGSAVEWGLAHFAELIELLPADVCVYITGTEAERALMADNFPFDNIRVHDLTGRLSLDELIDLIGQSDALVAASTGPLHIAAYSGIRAIGLYSPKRPIDAGRWAPIGSQAVYLSASTHPASGYLDISPFQVLPLLGLHTNDKK